MLKTWWVFDDFFKNCSVPFCSILSFALFFKNKLSKISGDSGDLGVKDLTPRTHSMIDVWQFSRESPLNS